MDQSPTEGQKERWWDLLAVLLLVAAILTATTRLVATEWVSNLNLVQTTAFLATFVGLLLGQSIFSRGVVFFFTLAYGLFTVPWQIGLTLGEGIEWNERLIGMWGRIQVVVNELVQRDPITDNLFFLVLMSVLFWIIGVYAGYQITRYGNAWAAIIPAGLATFVIHSFDPLLIRRSWYLAAYLFIALLLVARITFVRNRYHWKQRKFHIPPDISFDISRYALIVVAVMVFLSWTTPVLADAFPSAHQMWLTASRPWYRFRDRMSFAFASLRASVGMVTEYYGETHFLGRGNVLTDNLVMEIEAPRNPFVGARYYWRARVYDDYENGLWTSTVTNSEDYAPTEDDLAIGDLDLRLVSTFKFKPNISTSTVYVTPQPVWVSRPAELYLERAEDGTLDPVVFQAVPYIRAGDQYEVRSALSSVTQAQLRTAGTDYPQWILDRYLQLPDNITPRTRALAENIAQGLENPHDITEAITSYLRQNIRYSETISEIPNNQEIIDWFLFDYREGFCNYFATAEVILLRSLGIPARWAVGYAQGERQIAPGELLPPQLEEQIPVELLAEESKFTVRQRDAHAWPEVYFPSIGWVEFEPTAAQNPLVRPIGESRAFDSLESDPLSPVGGSLNQPEPDDFFADEGAVGSSFEDAEILGISRSYFVYILLVLAIGIGVLVFSTWRKRHPEVVIDPIPVQLEKGLARIGIRPPSYLKKWSYYAKLPDMARAYLEINNALLRLGQEPAEQATPAERVAKLINVIPQVTMPAQSLLVEYQMEMYGPHAGNLEMARRAGKEVRKESYQALWNGFLSRLRRESRFERTTY